MSNAIARKADAECGSTSAKGVAFGYEGSHAKACDVAKKVSLVDVLCLGVPCKVGEVVLVVVEIFVEEVFVVEIEEGEGQRNLMLLNRMVVRLALPTLMMLLLVLMRLVAILRSVLRFGSRLSVVWAIIRPKPAMRLSA